MKDIPPIYFYIPQSDFPAGGVPENADLDWSGFQEAMRDVTFGNSVYCWTLQTYLYLKSAGFSCRLTETIPDKGIIIAHRSSIPFNLRPKLKLFLISIKADHDQHPYANLQIVQNHQDANSIGNSYYIPLWSQPGLISRHPARGDKFENIAYFGIEKNLASEFKDPSWSKQLEALGLRWQIVSQDRWNDYGDIDAVVAVRSFENQEVYKYKPATKLYNSWLGCVPAVLGCDSAFRNERRSELDYLEVASVSDTIEALKRLRDNKALREAMVKNGIERAEVFSSENLVIRWRNFLTNVAIPAYYRWCNSGWQQKLYLAKHYLTVQENNLKPNAVYPHDQDTVNNDHIGVKDSAIVSTMQMYRQVRKLVLK